MAERNPDDLPPATEGAQEDVFSAEPRSYKMDRRSPEASALREAVSRKLLDFLGSYSDDVLTCNTVVILSRHVSDSQCGPQNISKNISKEDVESRTVFVTNVHFAASREVLVSHFTKCGAIIKVTMLTDTTGQPKGEAYIVFANKESVDKAISLSGTSFFSRILMVSRKSEMPSGSSMPTQPAMKLPQQQWYSPHKKGAVQRHHTSSHFQWKRDESVSRESSAPASTNRNSGILIPKSTARVCDRLNQLPSCLTY
ncbi:hypothetical protein Cni_G26005 [Canna indica]|uniref:RRM domain-containing protein n=1 Tax=Canna indica TaxID=4628 RepID=A0AAQ3L2W4_9LILI|nr:hypothetical protein Cni_G26005 [Canna indica]